MHINDQFCITGNKGLSRGSVSDIASALPSPFETGEIHITTSGAGLILHLFNPHKRKGSDPLSPEDLFQRGIYTPFTFRGIKRVILAPHLMILYPVEINGGGLARKRTLTVHGDWIKTAGVFFSDWAMYDVEHLEQQHAAQFVVPNSARA